MTLTEIRATLDFFNLVPINAIGVYEIDLARAAARAWRTYDGKKLGQMRDVIADRLELAQSRIDTAAHYQRMTA